MLVKHPLIKDDAIQEREYQKKVADACVRSSTLVILPTGTGKTVVALLAIAEVLQQRGGRILFLAPTKPLVEQHAAFLKQNLVGKNVTLMTGEKSPRQRVSDWAGSDVIVSTPQVIANDLKNQRIVLDEISLMVFDESHRSVGKYAYVPIAKAYRRQGGLVLGMTASPGGSKKRIQQVCRNLGVKNIEIRREDDPDLAGHIHEIKMSLVEIEVPDEIAKLISALHPLLESCVNQLTNMGFMSQRRPPTIGYLVELGNTLRAQLRTRKNKGYIFRALSLQATTLKVGHALELAETQGVAAIDSYFNKLQEEAKAKNGSKASRSIVSSPEFAEASAMLQGIRDEHPKIPKLIEIVSAQLTNKPDSKIMIFTNYRDSCEMVIKHLTDLPQVRVTKLVGQSCRFGDLGLKQKEQVQVLDRLKDGELNVLVATCVGEEGLDVANTDLVIFYEPVASEIRKIQRQGRTGRTRPGGVIMLVTKGTRDEASLRTSFRKEKAMLRQVEKLKREYDEKRGKALRKEGSRIPSSIFQQDLAEVGS